MSAIECGVAVQFLPGLVAYPLGGAAWLKRDRFLIYGRFWWRTHPPNRFIHLATHSIAPLIQFSPTTELLGHAEASCGMGSQRRLPNASPHREGYLK